MNTPITLLLDLDGTLLDTNVETLIPVYFQKLAARLSAHVPTETLLKHLMFGTRAMMANEDPRFTLNEVFDKHFYPQLGVTRAEIHNEIESFYDNIFPSLREIAKPIPGVVEFIEWAFATGHRVAIATNPLFPRKAIEHRLRWAGLPPETYPFHLISSYEQFHFVKPHPAYFAETLGRLGWPDGPVVMIGNDVEQDLIPAAALGLATYHALDTSSKNGFTVTGHGLISDLRAFLESTPPDSLIPAYTSPASILAQLRSTPAVLAGLLDSLPVSAWTHRPAGDEWSITEILCHMRDVEREVDQPRIDLILSQEESFIPGQNPDTWAAERNYNAQNGEQALRDFTVARLETLEKLAGLPPARWSRKTRHAIFGPTALQELLSFNAEHDRLHIQQLTAVLNPG
ncbi:MAG: Phosphoglycolate phosphatase [Anaerolineales bacterium]|nr:Phosphoglycolate phosphatase [Anaerolineales bacterium]